MKHFYMKFNAGDWLKDPKVSMLSPAARGIYIDILCAMFENCACGEVCGNLVQLSRIARCSEDEMKAAISEFEETGVVDVVTLCNVFKQKFNIINRRMKREYNIRKATKLRVDRHRSKICNADVTSKKQPSNNTKIELELELDKNSGINTTCETDVSRPQKQVCQHRKIIELYHAILPELPKVQTRLENGKLVYNWSGNRERYLRARWNEDERRQSFDWWRAYFDYVHECKFLIGKNSKGWCADLEWLIKPNNMNKVLQGNYNTRQFYADAELQVTDNDA